MKVVIIQRQRKRQDGETLFIQQDVTAALHMRRVDDVNADVANIGRS